MAIGNTSEAESFLGKVNYYRFVGYGLHYEEFDEDGTRLDRYKSGTRWEDVRDLCLWEDALRTHIFSAVGAVEILFRTAFCYELSMMSTDPFWYLDKQWFKDQFDMGELRRTIAQSAESSHEPFVHAFEGKYGNRNLPSWMAIEIVSFGKWSRLYGMLKHTSNSKKVASRLKVPQQFLTSWLRTLVVLRNACAHHTMLWNRTWTIRPSMTPKMKKLGWASDKIGVQLWAIG